jgi:methionyl aminopeptidase
MCRPRDHREDADRRADRAQATQLAGEHCKPGVTTDEIDRVVHEFLIDHGAYPSTLGYKGFPKSCCTSLNEVICHGIPDTTVLEDGDIVNVDVTAYLDGVHGDTDATFCVGEVSEEARLLVERTHEAMMRGIRAVAPGRPINAIGGSSRRTRGASATAWSATSPATASARRSTRALHPALRQPALDTVMEPG